MTTTAQESPRTHRGSAVDQAMNWLRSAEAWLDARGRGAWIAAMVLGFILFWPVGLAILFYMIVTSRFSGGCSRARSHRSVSAAGSTGNSAFDAYREETLRRLEEEQQAFEAFLKRLRDARDKAEFDQFMEDRARKLAEAAADSEADANGAAG